MSGSVLVTDGEQRAALASVRSLGAAGYRVVVTSLRGTSLAGRSRFASAEHAVGSPLTDPGAYRSELQRVVAHEGIEALLPVSEASSLAVLGHRETFTALVLGPSIEAFRCVSDKHAIRDVADRVGIRVPVQKWIPAGAPVGDLPEVRYPVVVKPRSSVVTAASGPTRSGGVEYAADASGLRRALERFDESDGELLIQERIEGEGVGVFLLRKGGRTWAVSGHRRIREKPPRGGVSVVRESVVPDAALQHRCEQLVESCGFEGVVMVELKIDKPSGEPVLIEINGRLWGSVQLAIDAGVDFPRLFVELWTRGALQEEPACRPGVRTRWFWGDVDHHIARVRGVEGMDRLGLIRAARQLFAGGSGRLEVMRRSDPGPFVYETRRWVAQLFGRSES